MCKPQRQIMHITANRPQCPWRQGDRRFPRQSLRQKGADFTDGSQSSKAILLSPYASMHAKPELEIYADEVQCAHGATCGALDEKALFYARSRGISFDDARIMLVHAFLEEVKDGLPIAAE
jgi:Fe-S cluster assembly protein SufD